MSDLLTTGDAARILGLSVARVRKLEHLGRLRAVRVGSQGLRVFRREAVEQFAERRKAREASQ